MHNSKFKFRWIALLTALMLVFSLGVPVLADGGTVQTNAVFSIDTVNATAGEDNVVLYLSVIDCPAFATLGFRVLYDNTALTLTDVSFAEGVGSGLSLTKNIEQNLFNMDQLPEAAFPDGNIFKLEFSVSAYAASDTYEVDIEFPSHLEWLNEGEDLLLAQDIISGGISVTGLNVAEVGSVEYSSLSGALTAAIATGQPATVTMISNAIVTSVDDRIVIPSGADITLDMYGFTINSALAGSAVDGSNKPVGDNVESATVEVQAGGKLNIVDTSTNKGGAFTHTTGDRYTRFLVNSGTLDMDNIKISNFYDGVRDGSLFTGKGSGTYGIISNCEFTASETGGISNNNKVALNFGTGVAGTVDSCEITGYDDEYGTSIVVGTYNDVGSLELLQDCTISGLVQVSRKGTLDTIKDNTIINKPEGDDFARALEISGNVGTIDGGYIEGVYDAIYIGSSGTVDLILDGVFEAWDQAVYNYGTVNEVRGGDFHVGYYNAYSNTGTTNLISGGTFKSDQYRALLNEGHIEKISGGIFTAGSAYYGAENRKTIGEISGGLFYSESYASFINGSSYSYQRAVIDLISGGTFVNNANSNAFNCLENSGYGSTIKDIAGGTFISKNASAFGISGNDTVIENLSGGTFIGKTAGLRVKNNSIDSITGGVFYGQGVAVYLDGATGDHEAHINDLSGGYFKTLGESGLIGALGDSTWSSTSGYNFATVPLRATDLPAGFPDEEVIEERDGFYHFGETADITWDIEGNETVDKFVIGDPVYYNHKEPEKADEGGFSFRFKAWTAGANQYKPADPFPSALEGGAIYTALFEQIGAEEEYEVNLNTSADNVNIGEVVDVDIIVSSEGNESFYGATIGVKYDPAKVEFDEISDIPGTYGIRTAQNADGTETLEIMCHNSAGYTIGVNGYSLATISFNTLAAGSASFEIAENPIIDQEDATESTVVTAGDSVQVGIWNLTVTFQAGDNVSFDGGQTSAYVKYNEAGLYTDEDRDTEFISAPIPIAAAHYTIDGAISGLVWKLEGGDTYYNFAQIAGMAFTTDATFTATASPSTYNITYPANVTPRDGIVEGKVTYNTDAVFTVSPDSGHTVDKVSYKLGDGEWTELTAVAGVYTIPGASITDNITIKVDQLAAGEISFISNDDYKALPDGFKLLKLTVTAKLETGAYEYSGNTMFYSSMYSDNGDNSYVYLYAIPNDVNEGTARGNLALNTESGDTCIELNYDGNVTLESDVNSTDVTLTYALYVGTHKNDENFTKAIMQKRLEADVDGDGVVDTADVQKIFNIWKTKYK